jgi:LuxR family transcriptional regulator, quorum-sensing system regulator CciR
MLRSQEERFSVDAALKVEVAMAYNFDQIDATIAAIQNTSSMENLAEALSCATNAMGFTYYALMHHIHPERWKRNAIALHNCPEEWAFVYADKRLYANDPILHACAQTNVGFVWDELPDLIEMTERREKVLSLFHDAGVGSGVTIPAHVPGEPMGSCTFATRQGQPFPVANILAAQLAGAFAFQSARRIVGLIREDATAARPLTPRQRDCLIWAMRGKTDSEIAQILGLSAETVTQHINMARDRYGVAKRMQLAIRAIYLGDIGFDEAIH